MRNANNIEEMILYEDKDVIVCQKPPGFPVQSKKLGSMDMESGLKNYRAKKGEPPYIAVVHRLDQPVQGVLVFGKNKESGGRLSRQIQQGKMEKIYLACVEKSPEKKEGRLVDELEKLPGSNTSRVTEKKTEASKTAILDYKVLKEEGGRALLEIRLETGRHHQIRVQLAYRGMPILGDTKYNAKGTRKGKENSWQEIALCAYKLSFFHPVSGKKMEFQATPVGNFPIV